MRSWVTGLAALTTVVVLAGCAGDGTETTGSGDSGAEGMDGMSDMDTSAMNEPGATPADEVDGDVRSGELELLETAPPGSEDVTGEAWLGQDSAGTTVTIRLEGLEPETDYVSHLHAQPCAEDDGGPHFQFEEGGEEVPPNEVHLGFASDAEGAGEATVTNDRRVEDQAPALVVHPADTPDNRLACADFS